MLVVFIDVHLKHMVVVSQSSGACKGAEMDIDQIEASAVADLPDTLAVKSAITTLDRVKPGASVKIDSISSSNPELFRKLHVMGIYRDSTATVLAKAPLGDPISISTLGYVLSLRLSEARAITVDLLS